MEGIPAPTPLPPIASPGGLMPPASGGFPGAPRPQPVSSGGVVGRPSADPEIQQQRIEKSAEQRRVESVLPKQVDSKLQVFRADRGGRLPFGAKPVVTILLKDLEAAKTSGTEADEVIQSKLNEKNIQEGKFICRFVDRAGKVMNANQFPPFELTLGEEDGEDVNEDGSEEGDDQAQQPPILFQQSAPAPTNLDLTAVARLQDTAREQEARRGNDMAVLIASMQASTNQMMTAMQQQQQQRDEAARREAKERDEREAARRSQFHTTLLGLVPLVMPFLAKMFGPKEATQSPSDVLMLELVKAKFSEKDGGATMMEQMMKLMGGMTEQQMKLQSQGAATAVQMQSEASSLVFKNMMSTMKELLENKPKADDKDDSTLQTILKAAGPLLANIVQPPAQQQPQVGYQQPSASAAQSTEQQAAPPAPPAETEQQQVRRRKVQPPPPPQAAQEQPQPQPQRPDPTRYTDDSRIAACLDTVRKLSTGEIPPQQRFGALQWIGGWAPSSMLEAVKSGSREQVMTVGQGAVMSSAVLINWLSTDGMIEFLEQALADLKLILDGTLTKESVLAGVKANAEFIHAQRVKNAGPVAGTVVPAVETKPDAVTLPPVPRRRRAAAQAIEGASTTPQAPLATAEPASTPPATDAPSSAPPEPPAPTAGG